MAERKSIVPSIQIPDSDLRSENKVPSATELLEQDKRLSSLGVQVQRRKMEYEAQQQKFIDYLLSKVSTLTGELTALREEQKAFNSERYSLDTIREEQQESSRSTTESYQAFVQKIKLQLFQVKTLLEQALVRERILIVECQKLAKANKALKEERELPQDISYDIPYGPAFLTNESQEDSRKCDSGIQVNLERDEGSREDQDNNNSRETIFIQSPAKFWRQRTTRHTRTMSSERRSHILGGRRNYRDSSLLGESADEITPTSTPCTQADLNLVVRSAKRAYRFSSNHNIGTGSDQGDSKDQSFYSERELGLNNQKRPTVYDAKYWLRKVTSFMEEKKELLQKNKASHAEIMRMMDENRKLKRIVKEKNLKLERMSTIQEKGEMQRTAVRSPKPQDMPFETSFAIKPQTFESYDPLRMFKAAAQADRQRARSQYIKQQSLKSNQDEDKLEPEMDLFDIRSETEPRKREYTIPPRPLEMFNQGELTETNADYLGYNEKFSVKRLGKQNFQRQIESPSHQGKQQKQQKKVKK